MRLKNSGGTQFLSKPLVAERGPRSGLGKGIAKKSPLCSSIDVNAARETATIAVWQSVPAANCV